MKKKKSENPNWLQELDRANDRLGDPIDERWWVEEYWPAHEDNDGVYWDDKVADKSDFFKTKAEAEAYIEDYEPDQSYHKLRIRSQRCYRTTVIRWI